MGFSVSGSTAVILVGLLISAGTLYPALDHYTEQRADALTARSERALTQQNTALETGAVTYNTTTSELTVTVQNTGASTLAVSKLDLLVDGSYQALPAAATAVDNDTMTDVWAPGEPMTITLTVTSTPSRIKLVTGPGVAVTAPVEVQ